METIGTAAHDAVLRPKHEVTGGASPVRSADRDHRDSYPESSPAVLEYAANGAADFPRNMFRSGSKRRALGGLTTTELPLGGHRQQHVAHAARGIEVAPDRRSTAKRPPHGTRRRPSTRRRGLAYFVPEPHVRHGPPVAAPKPCLQMHAHSDVDSRSPSLWNADTVRVRLRSTLELFRILLSCAALRHFRLTHKPRSSTNEPASRRSTLANVPAQPDPQT